MKGNNKKKESIFARKGFFVTLVVIVAAMIITLVMNLIMPEEEKAPSFDNEAWETALKQAKENQVYEDDAEPVNAETVPQTEEEMVETAAEPEQKTEDVPDRGMKIEKPVQGEIVREY